MIKKMKLAGWLAAGVLASGAAQAALIDRGGGMIYDSDLNITWLANANLGAGSSYDNGASTTDGRMTWANAVAWADNLVYGGYSDWRLPTTGITCFDYSCTSSEMGHLFYTELGGTAGHSILSSGDPDLSLFQNIRSYAYWSGTAYAPDPAYTAWFFYNDIGYQSIAYKYDDEFYAWAVRPGDVAAIPEPASALLVGLGLAGLAALRRRRCLGAS